MRESWNKSLCMVFAAACYKKQWARENGHSVSKSGLGDHKDYHAAKYEGDIDAALRVVRDTMDRLYIVKMKLLINDLAAKGIHNPILVAPYKEHGTNRLARAAAVYLGKELGLEVDTNIVQTNTSNRKSMTGLERLANPARFEGEGKQSRHYIIVEDNVTQGGTVAELRSHLERGGSKFAFACALSTSTGENINLRPSDKTILDVSSELSKSFKDWMRNVAKINIEGLTSSEIGLLSNVSARRNLVGLVKAPV